MADSKLSALTAETTVAKTDIAYFVDDPGGTPLSRKATIANLSKGIEMTNVPTASGAVTLQPAAGSSLNVTLSTTGDFIVNTNDLFVDTSNSGNVGFGNAVPQTAVDSSGIITSRSAVASTPGTPLEGIRFALTGQADSYDTTQYRNSIFNSVSSVDSNACMQLRVSDNINSQVSALTLMGTGNVGVDETNPDAKLHVKVGTADAVECLQLEQLDVSEGFVNFVSTSAASTTNPLTTFTTGNTIQGFLRIEINGTDRWIPFYNAPTS